MDLAFGVAADGYTAYLVAVNVFDRFTYALPLTSKEPTQVAEALGKLLKGANKKPKLISSDNGNEFLGPVSELLVKKKIAQAFKAVGDVNALGVVDRAIQTLKRNLAELAGSTGRSWPSLLQQAVGGRSTAPQSQGCSTARRRVK